MPGGVGPMTRAMLLANVVEAPRRVAAATAAARHDRRPAHAVGPVPAAAHGLGAPVPTVSSSDRVEEAAPGHGGRRELRAGPRLQWPLTVVLVGLVGLAGDRGGGPLPPGLGAVRRLRRCWPSSCGLVLSDREAGWLAVRSRRVDLLVLGSLALSLTVFSLIVPPPS